MNEIRYKMDHAHRGKALIINNQNFIDPNLKRNGSDKDVKSLKKLFKELKFDVNVFNDLKIIEMRRIIGEYSSFDYTNDDCFVCVFMSHGNDGILLGSDEKKIQIEKLVEPFKECPSLIEKPKIFLIQACRGDENWGAYNFNQDSDQLNETLSSETSKIKQESDYLFIYSTIRGYVSMRDKKQGACFIQIFCEILSTYREEEFCQILVMINNRVSAEEYQVSTFENRLTKKMYFIETKKEDGNYIGEFKNGLRHGKGICTYINGTRYEGHWLNGSQFGPGTFYYPDGKTEKGQFFADGSFLCDNNGLLVPKNLIHLIRKNL